MELIDIGVNLTHDSFDPDRQEVLDRAAAVGVTRMIVTGTSATASAQSAELATTHAGLYATAGVHPHHASELDRHTIDMLRELARQPRVVAIGECGLDFYRNFSPPAAQERAFAAQLELAADCGLPVFLHQRDAHPQFTSILQEHRKSLAGGVVKAFSTAFMRVCHPEPIARYQASTSASKRNAICSFRSSGAFFGLPRLALSSLTPLCGVASSQKASVCLRSLES